MDYSASHTGFVLAAYGLSAFVLLVMCAAVIRRDRKLRRQAQGESEHHGR